MIGALGQFFIYVCDSLSLSLLSVSIYGTIRDHIQEFYKGEMQKSLNLLINLDDQIQV